MTAIKARREVPESIQGIKIIDVDTHISEPWDLWTSRAPEAYKDRVPRVVKVKNETGELNDGGLTAGDYRWIVDGSVEMGEAGAGSVINKDGVKVKGHEFIHWPLTEASPAASFVEPRLDLMDEVGIWAQIIYPNVVGFGGLSKIVDTELRNMCCTIYNDAMIEMSQESGGRLNGMAILPWWDQARAVKEVTRAYESGLKGVNLSSDPQNDGAPDLSDPSWNPLWEVCEGLGMPVNFHIGSSQTALSWGGSAPWPSFSHDMRIAIGSSMLYLGNARVIGNIIYGGICERFPELKIVSVESGIGWVPFMLQALDYQAGENNITHLPLKPSEYFRRQMYACFWFEGMDDTLLYDMERVGIDRCMFETDFPHPTCLYPDPLKLVGETVAALDRPIREMILSGTAAKVYNLDVPVD